MQIDLRVASCNCLALRKTARAVSAFYDRFLAPAGLSSVQFSLLAEIHSAPGIAMQTLSKQLVMDRTSVVRAIQPLTRTGFIEQQANPENSRKLAMFLTVRGRQKFEEAMGLWLLAQTEFERSVGPQNSLSLRSELSTLAHAF